MNLIQMLKLYGPVKSDAVPAGGGSDAGADDQGAGDAGLYDAGVDDQGGDDQAAGDDDDGVTSLDNDDAGDDSAAGDDDADDAGDDDAGDDDDVADRKPVKGKKAAEPATLRLHPDDVKALRGADKQGQQQQRQPSPEEVKKLLNPVTVTPEYLKALGFEEPTEGQVKGFQQFANDIARNAFSMAKLYVQQQADQFSGALQPLQQAYQAQQVEQAKQQFYTSYPGLQKYGTVVAQVAAEIKAQGREGSAKDLFRAVAVETINRLRGMGLKDVSLKANHGAGGQQGGQQQQRSAVPRPNLTATPGRSQNGGQSGGSKNNPDADIYG